MCNENEAAEDNTGGEPELQAAQPAALDRGWSPDLCFYCGEREATTRDHVIPRSWFRDREELQLPTVPSCRECNRSYQHDEEYVRAVLTAQRNAGPEALALFDTNITRGFRRPEGRGLLRRVFENFEAVEVTTPAGLYIGHAPALRVETDRFERVVRKIIHGLYYVHFDERLDPDTHVEVTDISEMPRDEVRRTASILPIGNRYGQVVRYRCGRAIERPTVSGWVIAFFEGVILHCLTDCEERLRRAAREARVILPANMNVID